MISLLNGPMTKVPPVHGHFLLRWTQEAQGPRTPLSLSPTFRTRDKSCSAHTLLLARDPYPPGPAQTAEAPRKATPTGLSINSRSQPCHCSMDDKHGGDATELREVAPAHTCARTHVYETANCWAGTSWLGGILPDTCGKTTCPNTGRSPNLEHKDNSRQHRVLGVQDWS